MNLKLKIYLRGMGTGIIIATIIMMIAYNIHSRSIKREDSKESTTQKPIYTAESSKDENPSTQKSTQSQAEQSSEPETESQTETQTEPQTEAQTESQIEAQTETQSEAQTEAQIENETETKAQENALGQINEVTIDIPRELASSQAIADYLFQNGIVADGIEFNHFLESNGYDKSLHTGIKTFPYNASYDEIAQILIR